MTALPRVPRRAPDAHKGDAGRVLVVAGSVGMTGAAFLAAKSALRSGAGIVVTACSEEIHPILATKHTCVMVRPFPASADGALSFRALDAIRELAKGFDALVIGPGLGHGPSTAELARQLVLGFEGKVVVDADAITAFAGKPALLDRAAGELVLTPHPGELGRLLGKSASGIQADRDGAVTLFLGQAPRTVLVLKGKGSIVASRAARTVNETGNPGMATAGSGDVLSGVVGALLAAGMPALEAARLGVWIHGRAGDLAAARTPLIIATDILEQVPYAFAERTKTEETAP